MIRDLAVLALADEGNDGVEVVERDLIAEQDVLALAGLAQQKDSAALHNIDAVIDEGTDGLIERKLNS